MKIPGNRNIPPPAPGATGLAPVPAGKGGSGPADMADAAGKLAGRLAAKIGAGASKGGLGEQLTRLRSQQPELAEKITGLAGQFVNRAETQSESLDLSRNLREAAQAVYPHRKEFPQIFDLFKKAGLAMEAFDVLFELADQSIDNAKTNHARALEQMRLLMALSAESEEQRKQAIEGIAEA